MSKHRRPHDRVSNDIHPNKPGHSKPTHPTKPTSPANPTSPASPANPTSPTRPANPAKSSTRRSPDHPHPGETDSTPDAPDTSDDGYLPAYLDPTSPEFDPVEALQSLHLEIVDLDALAHAANESVVDLPGPSHREHRPAFDRAYALVGRVADETHATARRSYKIQAALEAYRPRQRAEP